jgi:hypothetical protein
MNIEELKETLQRASDPDFKIIQWMEVAELPPVRENEAVYVSPVVPTFAVKVRDINVVVSVYEDGRVALGQIEDPSERWIKLAKLVREERTTTVNGFVRAFQNFLQEVLEKEGRK